MGPELVILQDVPLDDIEAHSPLLAEAVARLRRGEVTREAGYDGEYGVIRLFEPGELKRISAPALFDDALLGASEPLSAPSGLPRPAGWHLSRRPRSDPPPAPISPIPVNPRGT